MQERTPQAHAKREKEFQVGHVGTNRILHPCIKVLDLQVISSGVRVSQCKDHGRSVRVAFGAL